MVEISTSFRHEDPFQIPLLKRQLQQYFSYSTCVLNEIHDSEWWNRFVFGGYGRNRQLKTGKLSMRKRWSSQIDADCALNVRT